MLYCRFYLYWICSVFLFASTFTFYYVLCMYYVWQCHPLLPALYCFIYICICICSWLYSNFHLLLWCFVILSSPALLLIFIGPRCPWGPIYGSWCPSVSTRLFADLIDVTLADEDSNSIPTDDVNRAILGNMTMQVAPSGGQRWN